MSASNETTPVAAAADDKKSPDGLPSQGMRTTVNFLLFVHLFSLGVMLVFNGSDMGLRQKLRLVPGFYLQLLGMDVDFDSGQRFNWDLQSRQTRTQLVDLSNHLKGASYYAAEKELTALMDLQRRNPRDISRRGVYHLTHGGILDVSHFLEFQFLRDGNVETVGLPGFRRTVGDESLAVGMPSQTDWRGYWPRQRYLRYQLLAREIARLVGTENLQDILPASVVESLLASEGLTADDLAPWRDVDGNIQYPTLICHRQTTRSPINAAEGADPWHESWFEPAYRKVPLAVGGGIRFNDVFGLPRDYSPRVSDESVDAKKAK